MYNTRPRLHIRGRKTGARATWRGVVVSSQSPGHGCACACSGLRACGSARACARACRRARIPPRQPGRRV
eukprot:4128439-Lingulodinium_polyedra.AAC.1